LFNKLFTPFNRITAQKGSTRIALNTLIISGQRLSAAVLSLVTTPIILSALGVEDYGLYAMTLGLVGTLAFINWSLSSTTQRFIAFSIGTGDSEKLKRIFASSLLVHGVYALIILLIIWLFGEFLVERFLNIPVLRIETAKIIIKFISIITFLEIITVPFTGLFRAHENFLYLAIIGISQSILKLGIAFSLQFFNSDRLIIFSGLLLAISLLIFIFNVISCKVFYPEVNFLFKNVDKTLLVEMMNFMGWTLLGAVAIMSRNQGVSVLLNVFFGVIANAAYGIAMQVNFALGMLAQGFSGSINPQIIKSAGAGETDRMIYLMRTLSKFTLISILLVAVPFFFEAPMILKLWLKNVPEDAVTFTRLVIIFSLVMVFSSGIHIVFEAIGKVKQYNIWISLILMLNLPLAFLFFKLDFPSYTIILTGIFLELICFFIRLYLLNRYVNFSIPEFLFDVLFKIGLPVCISIGLLVLLKQLNLGDYIQFVFMFILMFSFFTPMVYHFAFDQKQKAFAIESISKTFKSIKKFRNRL